MKDRDTINARARARYWANRDTILQKQSLIRAGRRDQTNARAAIYRETHRAEIRLRNRLWRAARSDLESRRLYAQEWRDKNRVHYREYQRIYQAERRATDPEFRRLSGERSRTYRKRKTEPNGS